MRDDQRPDPHQQDDDQEEAFDDALDDLFGPDEDEQETRPQQSGQTPQPPGGRTPPAREYEPDPAHHRMDDEHILGPENRPPPESYIIDDTAPVDQSPSPADPGPVIRPPAPRPATRDWRKIACFGCLALVGIPALCLAALVAYGLVADVDSGQPTVGVFVDDMTPVQTVDTEFVEAGPAQELVEITDPIMDGRLPATIEVDGQLGFGSADQPVPVGVAAPLGGGWTLQINSISGDANQIVADANMFNDPPAPDRQYIIAGIVATRTTEPAAIFEASFRLRLLGTATGTVYTTFEDVDRCGVIPDPVPDRDIISNEAVSGNVCWQVQVDDLHSLLLFNESFSDQDAAIWFDLTEAATSTP